MTILRRLAQLTVLSFIMAVAPAAAQDPPTAPDPKTPAPLPTATKKETKPADVQLPAPPMPEKMQTLRETIENSALVKRLRTGGDGIYPRAFSVWTGAGMSAGAGYREHVLNERALFNVGGEWSVRDY